MARPPLGPTMSGLLPEMAVGVHVCVCVFPYVDLRVQVCV